MRALPSMGAASGALPASVVVIFSRMAARNHVVRTPGAISNSTVVSSALPTTVACRPEVVTTRSPLTSDFCNRCASAIARFCRRVFMISSTASAAMSSSGRNWAFMVLRSPSALRYRVCQVAPRSGLQRLWVRGDDPSQRPVAGRNLDTALGRMPQQARPFGPISRSFVACRGPVGAATEPGLSGSRVRQADSLGFRQQSDDIRLRGSLREIVTVDPPSPVPRRPRKDGRVPSHRYSRPRYRPSAHALDTRTLGLHTLVSNDPAASAAFGFAGAPTATMTRSPAPRVPQTSSVVQQDAGFANTLLRHIEADEQAFVLQYVQPGLVGLIDGTLSTLAPIFAVALLSSSHAALLVGLATALGAGISMGLSEALSDDGGQTGRGSSTTRGAITGVMTTVGGVFHALPFLISDRTTALVCAAVVVAIELAVIALIRKRYLEVSLRCSLIQVVFGGVLIVGVGLWLGGL